jgi:SLT domain-containing protein
MFQRALPASALDHIAMRYLHTRYGSTGNVVAARWQAP